MSGSLKAWFFIADLLLLNLSISNLAWIFLVLVSTPHNVTKGWSVVQKLLRAGDSVEGII